ncbi:cupin domain-containing protein [Umezawaea sp.]|uniref:cupin domain-containing protein n=1 Tax=Umezawaea sp. TaxID=1955258 RepID=UPI002ED388C0
MSTQPIDIRTALDGFDALWSPRILTTVNDYDVRIAKVKGDHVWHVHESTDEFFLVLEGELDLALREPEGERVVTLRPNSVFVVPKGTFHKPSSREGAHIVVVEPSGTLTVGDRHEEVPSYVDVTTGHRLQDGLPD